MMCPQQAKSENSQATVRIWTICVAFSSLSSVLLVALGNGLVGGGGGGVGEKILEKTW